MTRREELKTWVRETLQRKGGEAHLVDIAKDIWAHHEAELRLGGDLFFTWQYDMRWAGTALRKEGVLEGSATKGRWKLVSGR